MGAVVEADAVALERKAAPRRRRRPGAEVPPGSKSGACGHGGLPGTWDALSSPCLGSPVRGTGGRKAPGPPVGALVCRWEQSEKRKGGTAGRRGSWVGEATGSRSIPVVPGKPEKSSRGDPVEGRGMPGYGIAGGRHGGNIEFQCRVNETP